MPLSTSARVSTKGLSLPEWMPPPLRIVWRAHLQSCMRRRMLTRLSPQEFATLTSKACHYCGTHPTNRIKAYPGFAYNGVDRVNNSRGYVHGNVVPCCKRCNSMKSSLEPGEFLSHVRRIAEYQRI